MMDLADPKGLERKYQEGLRKQRGDAVDQDFSDMVAEQNAKQNVGVSGAALFNFFLFISCATFIMYCLSSNAFLLCLRVFSVNAEPRKTRRLNRALNRRRKNTRNSSFDCCFVGWNLVF